MRIAGLQKTTLVDYPGKVAATVFTLGCNFRCPYCHNPELVLPEKFLPTLENASFFTFLEERRGRLEAVCITGGEPTIQPGLADFIRQIKDMGFLVKLDTNGTRPEILRQLFQRGDIDYIAMDLKAPLSKYGSLTGLTRSSIEQICASIALIMQSGIPYEFRTTVMKPLLEVADFEAIGELIQGTPTYYLQNYRASKQVGTQVFTPFTDEELKSAQAILHYYVGIVEIR